MARTTTEARRARGVAAAPARAFVRDFGSATSRAEVVFDARTAFDFLVSMNVAAGEESDLLPDDAAWLKRARGSMPADVRRDLDSCFGKASMGAFHLLPSVIIGRPEIVDADGFVAALDELSTEALLRLLLVDMRHEPESEALIERVLARDEAALSEVTEHFNEFNKGSVVEFLRDPEPAVGQMREVVRSWLTLYREIEPRVEQILRADVASRRTDRETLEQSTLIERTTGGLRWLPESRVRRIVMAPSYFARPYNYVYQGSDWRMFAYPVSDAVLGALDAAVPPQGVVRLYRALGDPTRLRVLKLLSERDWYLTELAQQLELSKPTMKHHLALLRAAGLVTVTDEGNLTYYSIRRERLDEAGVELHRFLS